MSTKSDFVQQIYEAALAAGMTDAAARVTASQAALESNYGTKPSGDFNYWGIKAGPSWQGNSTLLTTHEGSGSDRVKVKQKFRAYGSLDEAMADRVAVMDRAWPGFRDAQTVGDALDILPNGRFGSYYTDDRVKYEGGINSINTKYLGGTPVPPGSIPDVASELDVTPGSSYKVRSGDTLGKIAKGTGMTVSELAQMNGIKDPNKIKVGQVLQLNSGGQGKSAARIGGLDLSRVIDVPQPNTPTTKMRLERGELSPAMAGQRVAGTAPTAQYAKDNHGNENNVWNPFSLQTLSAFSPFITDSGAKAKSGSMSASGSARASGVSGSASLGGNVSPKVISRTAAQTKSQPTSRMNESVTQSADPVAGFLGGLGNQIGKMLPGQQTQVKSASAGRAVGNDSNARAVTTQHVVTKAPSMQSSILSGLEAVGAATRGISQPTTPKTNLTTDPNQNGAGWNLNGFMQSVQDAVGGAVEKVKEAAPRVAEEAKKTLGNAALGTVSGRTAIIDPFIAKMFTDKPYGTASRNQAARQAATAAKTSSGSQQQAQPRQSTQAQRQQDLRDSGMVDSFGMIR